MFVCFSSTDKITSFTDPAVVKCTNQLAFYSVLFIVLDSFALRFNKSKHILPTYSMLCQAHVPERFRPLCWSSKHSWSVWVCVCFLREHTVIYQGADFMEKKTRTVWIKQEQEREQSESTNRCCCGFHPTFYRRKCFFPPQKHTDTVVYTKNKHLGVWQLETNFTHKSLFYMYFFYFKREHWIWKEPINEGPSWPFLGRVATISRVEKPFYTAGSVLFYITYEGSNVTEMKLI